MKRSLQLIVALALAALMAAGATAQDDAKKQARQKKRAAAQQRRGGGQLGALVKKVANADLEEAQVAKVKEIVAEYKPKLADIVKQRRQALGREVRQKMQQARKAAAAEGKKGRALQQAALALLTKEQLAKHKELQAATAKVMTEVRLKITEVIGAEKAKELKIVPRRAAQKKKVQAAKKKARAAKKAKAAGDDS